MTFDLAEAKHYVHALDLSGTPRALVDMDAATEAGAVFERAKNQAQVVGSSVMSFAQGVDDKVREAISDAALLAQLVANKRTPAEGDPLAWFKTYSEVLMNLGWTLQDKGSHNYSDEGKAAEVHEKIIEVITAALAPAPAALAIITSTVNALKAMKPDSPWITLFSRESQKGSIARFQVGLVENVPGKNEVFVSMVACVIKAKNTVTQVLFFKFKDAKASFEASTALLSINHAAVADIGPAVRAKIKAYQADYLSSIKDI